MLHFPRALGGSAPDMSDTSDDSKGKAGSTGGGPPKDPDSEKSSEPTPNQGGDVAPRPKRRLKITKAPKRRDRPAAKLAESLVTKPSTGEPAASEPPAAAAPPEAASPPPEPSPPEEGSPAAAPDTPVAESPDVETRVEAAGADREMPDAAPEPAAAETAAPPDEQPPAESEPPAPMPAEAAPAIPETPEAPAGAAPPPAEAAEGPSGPSGESAIETKPEGSAPDQAAPAGPAEAVETEAPAKPDPPAGQPAGKVPRPRRFAEAPAQKPRMPPKDEAEGKPRGTRGFLIVLIILLVLFLTLLALFSWLRPMLMPPETESPAAKQLSVEELTEIERLLKDLLIDPGPIDGVVDDRTREAIRFYQESGGLPVDGEPTAALLNDLREVAGGVTGN